MDGFSLHFMFENLSKICQNIQVLLKSDKITVLFMQTDICAVMELFLCSVGTLCKLNVINWMIKFTIKWHIYSNNYL